MSDSNMGENEVLYYVANELRIKEKVKQYDGSKKMEENFKEEYGYDFSDAADEEVMEDMVRFEIERNIKERLVYLTVKRLL